MSSFQEELQDLRDQLENQAVAVAELQAKREKADKDKEETAKKFEQLQQLSEQGEPFPGQAN